MPGVHQVAHLPTALSRGAICYIFSCPSHSSHMAGHTALGFGRESPNPFAFPAWPGCVPDDMVDWICWALNLVVPVWHLGIGLMNLLAPCWKSTSGLGPTFILVLQARCQHYFPLESGCEDCSFLDQAVEDFEHNLDSILTDICQNTRTWHILCWLMLCLLQSLHGIYAW